MSRWEEIALIVGAWLTFREDARVFVWGECWDPFMWHFETLVRDRARISTPEARVRRLSKPEQLRGVMGNVLIVATSGVPKIIRDEARHILAEVVWV